MTSNCIRVLFQARATGNALIVSYQLEVKMTRSYRKVAFKIARGTKDECPANPSSSDLSKPNCTTSVHNPTFQLHVHTCNNSRAKQNKNERSTQNAIVQLDPRASTADVPEFHRKQEETGHRGPRGKHGRSGGPREFRDLGGPPLAPSLSLFSPA